MRFQPAEGGRRFRPLSGFQLLSLIALALLGNGCHRQATASPDITLTQEITPQPVRVGPVVIVLGLKDAAAAPVAGAHITLEGDMSHPGMAPVFGEAKEIAPGRYQGELNFAMGGDWVVLLHARLANGQRVEREIEVKGVEAK
jgi:YtkA-like